MPPNAAERGRRKGRRAAPGSATDCRLLVCLLICLFTWPILCRAMRWLLSWLPFLGWLSGAPEAMAGVQSTNSFYAEEGRRRLRMERPKGQGNSQAFFGPRLLPRDQFRKMAGAARAGSMVVMVLSPSPDVVRPHHLTGQIQEYTAGILYSFSEIPVLEEQIRESLSCCHYLAAEEPHRQPSTMKDLRPWPPSSPKDSPTCSCPSIQPEANKRR